MLILFIVIAAIFVRMIWSLLLAVVVAAMRLIPLRPSDSQLLLDKFVAVSRATLKGTLVIGIVQGGLAGAAFAAVGIQGGVFGEGGRRADGNFTFELAA